MITGNTGLLAQIDLTVRTHCDLAERASGKKISP